MEFLTISQASNSMNIPCRSLRRLVRERRVPFVQVGNRVYLIADELESALRKDARSKLVSKDD